MEKESSNWSEISENASELSKKIKQNFQQESIVKDLNESFSETIESTSNIFLTLSNTIDTTIKDEEIKKEMTKEFIDFYSKNIDKNSVPIKGAVDFFNWAKNKNISMAVCTNKQERLAIDLLKKLDLFKFFEYVAGSDTFAFNKPDPRHLTDVVEIIGGDLKKTMMIGDSEVDALSAHNAKLPFVLVKDGYTEKTEKEIKHNELISDFENFEKIIEKYL